MSLWWLFALFTCSVVLTGVVRWYAVKKRLIDIPNQRSSHSTPTTRGGGLSIVVVFLCGSLLLYLSDILLGNYFWSLCAPGLLVAAVGFLDDHIALSVKFRFVVQIIAAVGALCLIGSLPAVPLLSGELSLTGWWYLVVAVALIWSLNLYNFMDGIDGLAGVEAVCVAGGASLILWLNQGDAGLILWLWLLCVAALGFLMWNWPPAKIFMGDVGSGFLGLTIGLLALITSQGSGINIWSWFILYAVFFVDATVTLIIRFFCGEHVLEAHRSHTYQIVSRRWGGHLPVIVTVGAINIFWLLPLAFFAARFSEYAMVCAAIAIVPLCWAVIYCVARV